MTGLSPLLDFTYSVFFAVSGVSASALPVTKGGREHPQARGRNSLPADVSSISELQKNVKYIKSVLVLYQRARLYPKAKASGFSLGNVDKL